MTSAAKFLWLNNNSWVISKQIIHHSCNDHSNFKFYDPSNKSQFDQTALPQHGRTVWFFYLHWLKWFYPVYFFSLIQLSLFVLFFKWSSKYHICAACNKKQVFTSIRWADTDIHLPLGDSRISYLILGNQERKNPITVADPSSAMHHLSLDICYPTLS